METYKIAGGEFAGKNPQWGAVPGTLVDGGCGYSNPFYNTLFVVSKTTRWRRARL